MTRLCVPDEVQLDGDCLGWRWTEFGGSAVGHEAEPKGVLNRFLKIKTAAQVLAFACRYGPLGICQHGHPLCHAELPGGGFLYDPSGFVGAEENLPPSTEHKGVNVVSPPKPDAFYCAPICAADGWFHERITWWIALADTMRAAVGVASRLKQAQRPLRQDVEMLKKMLIFELEPVPAVLALSPDGKLDKGAEFYLRDGPVLEQVEGTSIDAGRSEAWGLVLELLNKWLIACPTRLFFTYADDRPFDGKRRPYRVDFSMSFIAGDQRGCFPALVFQLISEVRGGRAGFMVRCTNCEDSFTPRANEKFCPACRAEGWPQRYASRHYYANKRDEILGKRKRKRRATKAKRLSVEPGSKPGPARR